MNICTFSLDHTCESQKHTLNKGNSTNDRSHSSECVTKQQN